MFKKILYMWKIFSLEIPQPTGISIKNILYIYRVFLEKTLQQCKNQEKTAYSDQDKQYVVSQLSKNEVSQGISNKTEKPISVGNCLKMRCLKTPRTLLVYLHKQSKNEVSQGISDFLKMRCLKVSHKSI